MAHKLLLTWEAGAFLGHRMLVASAAGLMAARGHEVIVAAPLEAPSPSAQLPPGVTWDCCMPPLPAMGRQLKLPWESRATSLWNAGFQSPELIKERLGLWQQLLQRHRPDMCVLQAAPFAQLAARAAGLRSVEFGIGFDVPPVAALFPPFRAARAWDAKQAAQLEGQLRQIILQAAPAMNVDAPLSRLVAGDIRLVTSIAELDHYEGAPGRSFVGPLPLPSVHGEGASAGWSSDAKSKPGPRILAYLRHASVDMTQMLPALSAIGGSSVTVVCTDAPPTLGALAARLGISLHAAPIQLTPLLPHADLVVSHGGGLLAEAIVRGRPCVVLPSHYEQFMAARQAARHQVAVVLNPAEPGAWVTGIQHAAGSRAMKAASAKMAGAYRQHVQSPGQSFAKLLEQALLEG